MKKLVLLFLILLSPLALADTAVPNYVGYVNDFAGVFTPNQTIELNAITSQVKANTTAEIAILTVENVTPLGIDQYSMEVFDAWKIGAADKDNGLLIVYSKQKDDSGKQIWVTTGYGLEGILNDAKVGRILDETFVPARAANNSSQGIVLAVREYANVINDNADEVRSGQTSGDDSGTWIFLAIWIFLIVGMPAMAFLITPKCPKCKTRMKRESYNSATNEDAFMCPKCGNRIKKKRKMGSAFFYAGAMGGGFGGGGFGGGGFGGGGSGGGGAGR